LKSSPCATAGLGAIAALAARSQAASFIVARLIA
jgi:hypothetical protein